MAEGLKKHDYVLSAKDITWLRSYCERRVKLIDVTGIVGGHMDYRNKIKEILSLADFNQDELYFLS
jgi:hypothetical protein